MDFTMQAACAVVFTTALSGLGCSSSSEPSENVARSSDALSVYQWSADQKAGNSSSYDPASIATFQHNGDELSVMVHTGDDEGGDHDMYWALSRDGVSWLDDIKIDAMETGSPARLAAFNGHLYMVHTGEQDHSVWMSRLDTTSSPAPIAWRWGHDFLLPYKSVTSPALAVYSGSLYVIGSTPRTGQLWQATMSPAESFSAATDIPGQKSPWGSPSLTVYCPGVLCFAPTLFMAYRSSTDEVIMSGLQMGRRSSGAWWNPWVVTNVDGTHKQTSSQPALAAYQGSLHLVHTDPAQADRIMWTYYDGASWSTEVSLGGQRMYGSASLAARSDKLVMVHASDIADHHSTWPDFNTAVYSEYFQ
jgi:hypothetical protein